MLIFRSMMFSLALIVGASAGCSRNNDRDTTPRSGMSGSTDTTAQSQMQADMSSDVGNGTDTSGANDNITSPTPNGGLPCNNATANGQAGNPNCEPGATSGTNTNAGSTRNTGATGPALPEPPTSDPVRR